MKRLRNTGIYYTLFGILLAASFVFFQLWRISILGIFLLLMYLILRFGFKKKEIATRLQKRQLQKFDFFLAIFPMLYLVLTLWYIWRPYKQAVILPKDYEGVVAIQYDKPNGQEKNWTGGFLGIGASRLIAVDSTGIAETQFKFLNNAIPFLGMKQSYYNEGGLKIYYENDLNNEIIKGANGIFNIYKNKEKYKSNIYFESPDFYYPLMIFVLTKSDNYYNYFMTENEMILEYKQMYDKEPYKGRFTNIRKLNKYYQHFYKLQDYYLKN